MEEICVIKILFLFVLIYVICWILVYVIGFLSCGNLFYILFEGIFVVIYLVGLNFVCNFFIYGYMNCLFCIEFWKLVFCKKMENMVVLYVEMEDILLVFYIRI